MIGGGPPIDAGVLRDLAYTDVASVKSAVGRGAGAIRRAAQQFESVFIDIWLKSMREANSVFAEGSYLSSNEVTMHQEMLDHQWAVHLAENGGLGLAEVIARQLGSDQETAVQPVVGAERNAVRSVRTAAPSSAEPRFLGMRQAVFEDAAEFVSSLMPIAEQALGPTGLSPYAAIAQAALETGWGRKIIHDGDGRSSNNLFGIKATSDWAGDAVPIRTLEVRSGVPRAEVHRFRSYEDFAGALADYASVLTGSDRYTQVVDAGDDLDRFADALQDSGYATDPDYAAKIKRVAATLRALLGGD